MFLFTLTIGGWVLYLVQQRCDKECVPGETSVTDSLASKGNVPDVTLYYNGFMLQRVTSLCVCSMLYSELLL